MERKPLVVGNWKMELSLKAAQEVMKATKALVSAKDLSVDTVVCPSYVSLPGAKAEWEGTGVMVGAQNVHEQERGAHTGQVSVLQLQGLIEWCIVGHSEVRALTSEDDERIAQKAVLLLQHNIHPIICVGETQAERDADQTVERVTQQMEVYLRTIDRTSFHRLVIAYEPIWAIGTGNTPDPIEVSQIALLIRKLISNRFDQSVSDRVRILYGGSVKPDNVGPYIAEPGIDGVLIGGASVHPRDFVGILEQVQEIYIR